MLKAFAKHAAADWAPSHDLGYDDSLLQDQQYEAPLPEYFPLGHPVQLLEAVLEYFPLGHSAQPLEALPEYVPLEHSVQLLGVSQLSSYEAWPLWVQEPGGMYLPASQSVQELDSQLGLHR